jgi:hypothetical protein
MIFLASRSRLASAVGGSPDLRQLARKGAKFRCLFLSKILIHTPIQQRLESKYRLGWGNVMTSIMIRRGEGLMPLSFTFSPVIELT